MKMKSERSESRVSAGRNLVGLDYQQARLLGILARRPGELVTYDELRAAGIELPASLVAEIELSGVEIDRFNGVAPDGRPVRGVRLPSPAEEIAGLPAAGGSAADVPTRPAQRHRGSPMPESASTLPAASTGWGAVRVYRDSLRRAIATGWLTLAGRRDGARFAPDQPPAGPRVSRTHLLAPVALLIGAAVTAAVVVAAIAGGAGHPRVAARANPRATGPAHATVTRPAVHHRPARSKAHAARSTASAQTAHVVASDAGQQTARAASADDPASSTQTSAPRAATSTAPVASTPSGQSGPQAAVQAFYEAAAQHRYAAAWALADTNMREQVGGYAAFANQMSSVREISFRAVDVLQRAPTSATIAIRTTSVQTTRSQECWGTVRTVEQFGAWLLDGISIDCS